jgi:nucleoside-diphosphate-sugar epimerase
MSKYLVTGGSGFIGANLVHSLVEKQKNVVLINEPGSNLWRLKDICDKISAFEASLTDFEKINSLVSSIKPDVIFHLAAYGGLPNQQDQKHIFDVNFYGMINLFNACKKNGFDCFINTGSSSEYGIKNSAMNEQDVPEPVSDYGVAKAASTQFCVKEALFNKLTAYTIRPFAVYGDFEMNGRLIPTVLVNFLLKKQMNLSSPDFVRDFIYVKDIVDAYITLSDVKPKNFYVFNIGTGVQTSIGQLVQTVQFFSKEQIIVNWGKSDPRPWEPKIWRADITRAKEVLGWQPKYSLKDGLAKSLEWFGKNLHFYNEEVLMDSVRTLRQAQGERSVL